VTTSTLVPRPEPRPDRARTVVVVGAGPRGASVLERLAANASAEDGGPVEVHLVDPYPPGAGRIWREDQSPLLWMNSHVRDVAMYPDAAWSAPGVLREGPTLWDWVRTAATGCVPLELAPEAAGADDAWFASRRLQSHYLRGVVRDVSRERPDRVRVHVHADVAVDVADAVPGRRDGRQVVRLASGATLEADVVVLAQGHLDVDPAPREAALARAAARHGLAYVPPGYAADLDLDALPAGEPVLVLGLGLGFVDDVVLLTQGRGGRYERGADGVLAYRPSGREPVLFAGSRRGVPYHAKIGYPWSGEPPRPPRWFTADVVAALTTPDGLLDLDRDLWPLAAKELTGAYYRRLLTAHPERAALSWEDFEARYDALPASALVAPGLPGLAALVAQAVPDPDDRLDLAVLDRPAAGLTFTDSDEAHRWVLAHAEGDLRRHADPAHSADLALFYAFLGVYGVLATVATLDPRTAPRVTAVSHARLDEWWHGFFSFYCSGPPQRRAEEVVALARAGVLRFTGPDLVVDVDEATGMFRGRSASVPLEVRTTALLDARLPAPSVERARDALVRALHARGDYAEHVVPDPGGRAPYASGKASVDGTSRLRHEDGTVHPRRLAVGPWVAGGGFTSAFARPGIDAGFFRQNDAVAREVLAVLARSNATDVARQAPEGAVA
jgi:hypothetical protein